MKFVVSNDLMLYGPFDSADEATAWAKIFKSPWSIQPLAEPMTQQQVDEVKMKFETLFEALGSPIKHKFMFRRTHATQQSHHPRED